MSENNELCEHVDVACCHLDQDTLAASVAMKSDEQHDDVGISIKITKPQGIPVKKLKNIKSQAYVNDGAADQVSSDVQAENSGTVHIRRMRKRCKRHRQTASCSHDRQMYAQDRYAVLFEPDIDKSSEVSPVSVARDLRYGSDEVQSFEPLDTSKYSLPEDRPPIQKHQLVDIIYDSELHNLNASMSAASGHDSLDPGYSDESDFYVVRGNIDGNLAHASSRDLEIESQERLDALAFLDPDTQNPHYLEMFGGPVDHLLLGAGRLHPTSAVFPSGTKSYAECKVCLLWTDLNARGCCGFHVCKSCLVTYFETQVSMANVKINCIGTDCSVAIHREEILALLEEPFRIKFNQFLVDANKNPRSKTCPRCSHVRTIDDIATLMANRQIRTYGYRVECGSCNLLWCFPCQAPWHEPIKCKVYQRGDKLLKNWAREQHYGQANAQKCPKCKVYIQRSSGCDHMTCSRCKTNFCYRCGEQFRELKFIGNHYSKLSIFGCKYRFMPDNPLRRKLIRGSIFGGKLLAAPVIGGLAVGAGAVVIGVGALALPVYGAYKLHRKLQQTKRAKRQRRARDEMFRKLEDMHKRGEELDISNPITNTDIIAEIEASQIVADSLMRHSIVTSMFLSASDDDDDDDADSMYVFHMEQSSYDSDSSCNELPDSMKSQNKSCQTSHIAGLNLPPDSSLPSQNTKGALGEESNAASGVIKDVTRRGLLRKQMRRGVVETHSMPQLDTCGRPPSPAYFMFTRPSEDSDKEELGEDIIGGEGSKIVSGTSCVAESESEKLQEASELFKINVDDSDCEECEICYLCSVSLPKRMYDEKIKRDDAYIATLADQYSNSAISSTDAGDRGSSFTTSPRNDESHKVKTLVTEDKVLKHVHSDAQRDSYLDEEEESKKGDKEKRFSFRNHIVSAKVFPLANPPDDASSESSLEDKATFTKQQKLDNISSKNETLSDSVKHSSEDATYVLHCSSSSMGITEKDYSLYQKGEKSSTYILPCDFVIHL